MSSTAPPPLLNVPDILFEQEPPRTSLVRAVKVTMRRKVLGPFKDLLQRAGILCSYRAPLRMCWSPQSALGTEDSGMQLEWRETDGEEPLPGWEQLLLDSDFAMKPGAWEREYGAGATIVVIGCYEESGRMVGTGGLVEGRGNFGVVHLVAAHPDRRGRGLGRIITRKLQAVAVSKGMNGLLLLTDDFRLSAIKTYLDMDFIPCMASWDITWGVRWKRVLRALGVQTSFCALTGHANVIGSSFTDH